MAELIVPVPSDPEVKDMKLTVEGILENLRKHSLVKEAYYENGEFWVIPKDPHEKPFGFRIIG